MASGGLTRWFKEDWVDLSRPKKGGGYEPCGRDNTHSGHYPKCVPAARAEKMTPEQIKSAISRKRRAESTQTREGKKPIMVETVKKENVPTNMELYNRVKAAAKAKFDVYPSAYANGWLVQEYKRRGGKYKTVSKDSPTTSDVHVPVIMGSKKKRDLKKKKMAMDFALRKEQKLKDPKGGLTAAGRAKFNRETGSKLKPGVKGKADTPEKMRRKGSFLTRFFTNPSGPMVNDKGEPTRLALSAAAWGEPVPKNRSDAAKLAERGRNLLERYKNVSKGESAGHPFRGNQWTKNGGNGIGLSETTAGASNRKSKNHTADGTSVIIPSKLHPDDRGHLAELTGKAREDFIDELYAEPMYMRGGKRGGAFREDWKEVERRLDAKQPKVKSQKEKDAEVESLNEIEYKLYDTAPKGMKHDDAIAYSKSPEGMAKIQPTEPQYGGKIAVGDFIPSITKPIEITRLGRTEVMQPGEWRSALRTNAMGILGKAQEIAGVKWREIKSIEVEGVSSRKTTIATLSDGSKQYLGHGNKYILWSPGTVSKGESQGHPFRGNQWTKSRGGAGLSEQKSPKKTAAQKSKEVNALTPTQYKRYINAPIKMKHDEAMKHAKTSPLKGQPRPKAPTKQGDAQLKGRITPLDAASKVRAIKVHEYMKKPASNFKDPAIRKYALVRIKQMTTGVARPSGMSKKYGIDAGQVRSTEIVLSKIFAAGRKKFDI